METKKVNKTEFVEVAKAIGTVTYQIVSNGNFWFEQLTDGDAVYQHKLLTLQKMTVNAMLEKAHNEPSRLKDASGCTYAFVYESGSFVYYCLVPVTKREKARADRQVRLYAQCLASKRATRLSNPSNENKQAA